MTADPRAPDGLPYSAELIAAAVRRIGDRMPVGSRLLLDYGSAREFRVRIDGCPATPEGWGTSVAAALISLADRLSAVGPKP